MKNKEKISIRTYKKGDEYQIINLLRENLGQRWSYDYWNWKYKNNPLGFLSILAVISNDEIVGHVGIPKKIGVYKNKEILILCPCDLAVKKGYRGRGIAGKFPRLLPKKYISLGFPNDKSIYSYKKYPKSYMDNLEFLKINNYSKELKKFTFIKNYFLKRKSDLKLIKVINFPKEELNTLWQNKKIEINVGVKRDYNYLNWRFSQNKNNQFYIIKFREIMIGYIVLIIKDNNAFIHDILVLNNYLNKNFVKEIELLLLKEGYKKINISIKDDFIEKLLKKSNYTIKDKSTLVYQDHIKKHEKINPYITLSDSDTF